MQQISASLKVRTCRCDVIQCLVEKQGQRIDDSGCCMTHSFVLDSSPLQTNNKKQPRQSQQHWIFSSAFQSSLIVMHKGNGGKNAAAVTRENGGWGWRGRRIVVVLPTDCHCAVTNADDFPFTFPINSVFYWYWYKNKKGANIGFFLFDHARKKYGLLGEDVEPVVYVVN